MNGTGHEAMTLGFLFKGFKFAKINLFFFAVPVTLVTSTTTTEAPMIESETSSTSIKLATSDADDDTHGCHIDGEYYQDGMQVRCSF